MPAPSSFTTIVLEDLPVHGFQPVPVTLEDGMPFTLYCVAICPCCHWVSPDPQTVHCPYCAGMTPGVPEDGPHDSPLREAMLTTSDLYQCLWQVN